MASPFDAIDPKSGNGIGGFASEADALASLQRAFRIHRQRAIRDLSLMQITDDQIVVAMQEDLERLVRDSAPGVIRSSV